MQFSKKAEEQALLRLISPQDNVIINLKKFISGATKGSMNKQLDETLKSLMFKDNTTENKENYKSLDVFQPANDLKSDNQLASLTKESETNQQINLIQDNFLESKLLKNEEVKQNKSQLTLKKDLFSNQHKNKVAKLQKQKVNTKLDSAQNQDFGTNFMEAINQVNFDELQNLKDGKDKGLLKNSSLEKNFEKEEKEQVNIYQKFKHKVERGRNYNFVTAKDFKKNVGVIPPYTLNIQNLNNLHKVNPYQKYEKNFKNGLIFKQSEKKKQRETKINEELKNIAIVNLMNLNDKLKSEGKMNDCKSKCSLAKPINSGSIKNPKVSSTFYLNAKQLQNAILSVKPFQKKSVLQAEHAKFKLNKLIGKKRKYDEIKFKKTDSQINNEKQSNTINKKDLKQMDKDINYQNRIIKRTQDEYRKGTPDQIKLLDNQNSQFSNENQCLNKQEFGRMCQQLFDNSNNSKVLNQKCTSSVKSFVGGLIKNDLSSDGAMMKHLFQKNIETMNENLKELHTPQLQKISGFAQQIQAIKQFNRFTNNYHHGKDSHDQSTKQSDQQSFIKNCQSALKDQSKNNILKYFSQEDKNLLKQIPKNQLYQLGLGDLAFENNCVSEKFLSETSIDDSNFHFFTNDQFFDIMKNVSMDNENKVSKSIQISKSQCENTEKQSIKSMNSFSINDLKIPQFNPCLKYDSEFYKLFMINQQLLEEIENHAIDKNEMMDQILRIEEFYDQKISKSMIEKDEKGRKIHKRKTMAELQRDFNCPYDNCGKIYASEGSLNLHIKRKHNGGNKTEREKIAKSLLICQSQGINPSETIDVNLPPGIIKKVAEKIECENNMKVCMEMVDSLESLIQEQNKIDEKRSKEIELAKAQEEAEKAQAIVQFLGCSPPKKSKFQQFYHQSLDQQKIFSGKNMTNKNEPNFIKQNKFNDIVLSNFKNQKENLAQIQDDQHQKNKKENVDCENKNQKKIDAQMMKPLQKKKKSKIYFDNKENKMIDCQKQY